MKAGRCSQNGHVFFFAFLKGSVFGHFYRTFAVKESQEPQNEAKMANFSEKRSIAANTAKYFKIYRDTPIQERKTIAKCKLNEHNLSHPVRCGAPQPHQPPPAVEAGDGHGGCVMAAQGDGRSQGGWTPPPSTGSWTRSRSQNLQKRRTISRPLRKWKTASCRRTRQQYKLHGRRKGSGKTGKLV